MQDYNILRVHCQQKSDYTDKVIDEFLIYYAAGQDSLDQEFETRIARFRQAEKSMAPHWKRLLKTQYIAHRIFKQGGLIHKYLNHPAIRDLETGQINYLKNQAANPWKYSFTILTGKPAPDFYFMLDVFSGETYLFYSRSVSEILITSNPRCWFNLIGFNGLCWQTFGPLAHFVSFDGDDIFFYAIELNPMIESEDDLIEDIEKNPIPYSMLMTGSAYPISVMDGHEMVRVSSESPLDKFDMPALKKDFRVEYADDIFRLSQEPLSGPPHFAEAYYAEKEKILHVFALTDRGYLDMVRKLNVHGYALPEDPEIHPHIGLLKVVEDLLKKKIPINPFSEKFIEKPDPESDAMVQKINHLLALALPFLNAGQHPDIEALAQEAGVDPEVAKEILQTSLARTNKLRKK
ncbi:MAG: hypothetical protein SGI96_12845 [Bacteroidota bacterium]|nr:hypothetical protein [Bacteroidota bacterium]